MSKVKIYKCHTCDHFHCDNPEKHIFNIAGSEFMLYRQHRSSIRLVQEEFKQRLRAAESAEKNRTGEVSPPRTQNVGVSISGRKSQEQAPLSRIDSQTRLKRSLENTARTVGQSPNLPLPTDITDHMGSSRDSQTFIVQDNQYPINRGQLINIEPSPTTPFPSLGPSSPRPNAPDINPKILISEDKESRSGSGGTPSKSPIFGDSGTLPTERPSIQPTNEFVTNVNPAVPLQPVPSRYELKPTFNEYNTTSYVTNSTLEPQRQINKPPSQSFHSTNVTSTITYEPINMKSVIPELSFTHEGRPEDNSGSRQLSSRVAGDSGIKINDPFKRSDYSPMGSVQSSTGLYQPRGDLYQIIDSPARPLAPTIPHLSAFKREPFGADHGTVNTSSLSFTTNQYVSNLGGPAIGTGPSLGGGRRFSPTVPASVNFQPINNFQPAINISPMTSPFAFSSLPSTFPSSPFTSSPTRFSHDININVIPPSASGDRYSTTFGQQPPSIYSYSPPKFNYQGSPPSGVYAPSPSFPTNNNRYSPSAVKQPGYIVQEEIIIDEYHPDVIGVPEVRPPSMVFQDNVQPSRITIQPGSQRTVPPQGQRIVSPSQVHSSSEIQQSQTSSRLPGNQQLRDLLQGNTSSSNSNIPFSDHNNQYSSNNQEPSEEMKRNWIGRNEHNISVNELKRRLNQNDSTKQETSSIRTPQGRINVSRRIDSQSKYQQQRPVSVQQRSLRLISKVKNCTLEDNRCFGLNCMAPLLNPNQYEVQLDERGHRTRSIYK